MKFGGSGLETGGFGVGFGVDRGGDIEDGGDPEFEVVGIGPIEPGLRVKATLSLIAGDVQHSDGFVE